MIKPCLPLIVKIGTDLKTNCDSYQMGFDMKKAVCTALMIIGIFQFPLQAQQSAEKSAWSYGDLVYWAYGQDQELVNGMQYYNKNPRSLGHPYFMEGLVHQGSVSIRGKIYSGVWLKYDIHKQQVEVEYQTMNGGENQVILVGDRLDNFTIGEQYFRRMLLDEELGEQFYQVIGSGNLILYIRWEKRLVPISGDSRFIEEFTSPRRSYLLELNGSVQPFTNKKSFVALFPREVQKDMKRLIKQNRLLIKSASTRQLELFTIAAGNVLNGSK
jgi:hypothetical protein